MKKLSVITAAIFALLSIFGCVGSSHISNEQVTDSATLRSMINSHKFVFVAQYVNPIGISRRDITSGGYDISIIKDTIVSYLPFFGRGYTAPISPSDVDFQFTSTHFNYNMVPARNGWVVRIKPTDQNYLQELYFRIFDNGRASLNVNSINRTSVSYDGYIAARKVKEPKSKK